MLTPAVRPAAALYSTAAKSTSKPTAGAEFRDLFSPKKIKKNWESYQLSSEHKEEINVISKWHDRALSLIKLSEASKTLKTTVPGSSCMLQNGSTVSAPSKLIKEVQQKSVQTKCIYFVVSFVCLLQSAEND
ncbi:unnamed protein product [Hermetia illucens]|uniref:Uncharacterized protein n=1 Tax=Hermetia illucens TaxID=343691 RepID=A0A7R8V593_HERIL|nr:unnamed protein product [Hermetia illucens]